MIGGRAALALAGEEAAADPIEAATRTTRRSAAAATIAALAAGLIGGDARGATRLDAFPEG